MSRGVEDAIALIGNAPPTWDRAKIVDRHRLVVRINRAIGYRAENGVRTSHLVLVNCGGQMREWLDDPSFCSAPAFRRAGVIVLPTHPDKDQAIVSGPPPPLAIDKDGRNYAVEATAHFRGAGKLVEVLPPNVFVEAWRVIGAPPLGPGMKAPSTGLLSLIWLLGAFPKQRIDTYGFAFTGWRGHAWDLERRFFGRLAARERIVLHDA